MQEYSYKDHSLREFITQYLQENPNASVADTHIEVLTKYGKRTYSRVALIVKQIKEAK